MTDNIPTLQAPTYQTGLELLESSLALKTMPHVYEKVKKLWGFPAFFEYMDSLMLVEKGRENRQGFPAEVYRELAALEKFFVENPVAAAHPTLTAADCEEIRQIIHDRAFRVNYSAGDRR